LSTSAAAGSEVPGEGSPAVTGGVDVMVLLFAGGFLAGAAGSETMRNVHEGWSGFPSYVDIEGVKAVDIALMSAGFTLYGIGVARTLVGEQALVRADRRAAGIVGRPGALLRVAGACSTAVGVCFLALFPMVVKLTSYAHPPVAHLYRDMGPFGAAFLTAGIVMLIASADRTRGLAVDAPRTRTTRPGSRWGVLPYLDAASGRGGFQIVGRF